MKAPLFIIFPVCRGELVLFVLNGLGEGGLSEEQAPLGWRLPLLGSKRLDSDACEVQLLHMAANPSYP